MRTSSAHQFLLVSAALSVGVLLAVGCRSKSPLSVDSGLQLQQRLLAEEPNLEFDRTEIFQATTVSTWGFESEQDLVGWEFHKFDLLQDFRKQRLLLQSSKRRPQIRRSDLGWQADRIDGVEIELSGFQNGLGRLYWAAPGEKFDEARSVTSRSIGKHPASIGFDMLFHRQWKGAIDRIAIELYSPKNRRLEVARIEALDYELDPEQQDLLGRSWKVEIGHDLRNGLVLTDQQEHRLVIEDPSGAEFRLAFGLDSGVRRAASLVVTGSVGSDESILLEHRLDPAVESELDRWYELRRELPTYPRGQQLEVFVRLDFEGPVGSHGSGLAYVANPEVRRAAPLARRPNVVLISLDTLRADHMSVYGYERSTTPQLERWSDGRAVVFENVVAASSWTIPAHLSMMTGIDALRHGVNHPAPIPGQFEMIAESLQRADYRTMAVTGGGFMQPGRGFSQGFDRYRYWPRSKSEDELLDATERALEWIEESYESPFFLFFHTYEVHFPYRRREPFFSRFAPESQVPPELHIGQKNRQLFAEEGFELSRVAFWKESESSVERHDVSDRELQEIKDRYDSSIAYTDETIARILNKLSRLEIDDQTIVIITSDHGEAFGEMGLAGHAYTYDFNLLIPLLMKIPGIEVDRYRVAAQVRTIDILPTILEAVGLESPAGIDGASLLDLVRNHEHSHPEVAWSYSGFSNRGVSLRVDNRIKYLFNNTAWPPLNGRGELFDLQTDPRETTDLSLERVQSEASLRRQVDDRIENHASGVVLHIRNRYPRRLEVELGGVAVHPSTVKASRLAPTSLEWLDHESARLDLPSGAEAFLVFERTSSKGLRLRAKFEDQATTFERRTRFDDLDQPLCFSYRDREWHEQMDCSSESSSILLEWRSAFGQQPAPVEVEIDGAVSEQLEALGYLN